MSALVETAVYRSLAAVVTKDRKTAEEVLQDEVRVNQMQIEVDDQAISLLALRQPMAGDLRLITSAIKINSDLERIGDLSVNIAQQALVAIDAGAVHPAIDLPLIGGLVQGMVRSALDAFVRKDVGLADRVLASDDQVDALRTASFNELIRIMQKDPARIPECMGLLSIVRNLERIADHATNIAEDVLFYVKGVDVRHQGQAPPDQKPEPRV